MKPRVIGLLVTLRCNAACRHCCFESDPTRVDRMSDEEALSYMRQIGEVGGLKGVSITGGEPFLEYPLLKLMLAEGAKYGMGARVVSNCFWAVSTDRAVKMLEPLHRHGMRELSVSFDAVHEEFVKAERIKYAIEAALRLDMKVVVSTVTEDGDICDYTEHIRKTLGLPEHKKLFIMPGYIVSSGRARELFPVETLALVDGSSDQGERLRHPCPHVIREPIIGPDGTLYACCSPSAATRNGFREQYAIGNLKQQSLDELLQQLDSDVTFNAIMIDGPWSLFSLIEDHDASVLKRKRFVNICDLCNEVLTNPLARQVLAERLPAREAAIRIKRILIEASAGGDVDEHISRRLGLVQMRPHK